MKIKKIIIALLFFLGMVGLITRVFKIETVPPHFSNDEISIAYDSYSINKTHKDEYGFYLPISFKSHGTYKAPGYAYILSPLYIFLKNNNTVARSPSVLFGFLTVIVFGFIVYELTKNKIISFISSVILISAPWHIVTSRMVLESNIALSFFSLAIFFFLKSISAKKNFFIFISVLCFAASMYCYHTEWLISPLLLFLMLFLFFKKKKKIVVCSLLFFLILILPLFLNFLSNLNTSARANTEVIWKGESVIGLMENKSILLAPVVVIKAIFEKYLEYTNIGYLFFNGTELLGAKHIYEQGLFLSPLILAFFIGIFYIKKYIKKEYLTFFIIFIFLSPLVSSLTHGSPSLVRNLNTVLPYSLIISLGIYQIIIKQKLYKQFIFLIIILISSVYFFQIYMFHYPKEKAEGFQGYSPIALFLKRDSKNYDHIYVDYKFGKKCQYIGVPHLYLSYYQNLDPILLHNRFTTNIGNNFGKYTITQIDWNNISLNKKDLYIVSVCNPPVKNILGKLKLTNQIIDISGNPAFEIWEPK